MTRPRRTVADLARENAQLREYIAASKEVAEAHTIAEAVAEADRVRAASREAAEALKSGGKIIMVAECQWCGEAWLSSEVIEERRRLALDHDKRCDKNPIRAELAAARAEVTALRRALIHVADLQLRRRRDLNEVWAFREVANDLSEPFSDCRVQAEIERYTKEDRKP